METKKLIPFELPDDRSGRAGATWADTITATVDDGQSGSADIQYIGPPVADDESYAVTSIYATSHNTPLTILVPADDTDPAGGALQFAGATLATGSDGQVTFDGNSITYTPGTTLGVATISYTLTSTASNETSQPATISVDVTNALPELQSVTVTGCSPSPAQSDYQYQGILLANDYDPDGLTFAQSFDEVGNGYALSLANADGEYPVSDPQQGKFDIPDGSHGWPEERVVVKANDGFGDSNLATVTLPAGPDPSASTSPAGPPPYTAGNSYIGSILPGETVTGTLPEFDPSSVHFENTAGDLTAMQITNDPGNLAASQHVIHLNSDGTFTYAAPENFTGRDWFTYQLSNSNGTSDYATVFVDVTAHVGISIGSASQNDDPTIPDGSYTPLNVSVPADLPPGSTVKLYLADNGTGSANGPITTTPASPSPTSTGSGDIEVFSQDPASGIYTPIMGVGISIAQDTDGYCMTWTSDGSDAIPLSDPLFVSGLQGPAQDNFEVDVKVGTDVVSVSDTTVTSIPSYPPLQTLVLPTPTSPSPTPSPTPTSPSPTPTPSPTPSPAPPPETQPTTTLSPTTQGTTQPIDLGIHVAEQAQPLDKLDVDPRKNRNSTGSAEFIVDWVIMNQKANGWVVQHIKRATVVHGENGGPRNPPTEYWEAWQVVNGVVYRGRMNADGTNKMAGMSGDVYKTRDEGAGTDGTITVIGKVKFVVDAYPASWGPAVPDAGGLPSTYEQPPGWSDDGTVEHDLTVNWNDTNGKNTVEVNSVPKE